MATKEISRIDDFFEGRRAGGNMHWQDITIDPQHIALRDYASPDNRAHIEWLKKDILAIGVQFPVSVRFDAGTKRAILMDGGSRYYAVKELNEAGHEVLIPVIKSPEKLLSDEQALERSVSSNTGKPFQQWEVGVAYAKFANIYNWPVTKIAERFSKSERYVRDAIELSEAPAAIKAELAQETITVAVALKALRNKGSQAVQAIQQQVSAAKASGKTKVVAGYTKRAQVTKIPNDLIVKLHKELSKYEDRGLVSLADQLSQYLPTDNTQGKAAKELDSF